MLSYAVALGMFDSVHIGHRAVLDEVLNEESCRGMVLTFDAIPNKRGGVVLSEQEKREKLMELGIDTVNVLTFDEIKELSPKGFFDIYVRSASVKKVVCGFNFRFGKEAEGDIALLSRLCSESGTAFYAVPEVTYNGKTVSTTYIKELLRSGDAVTAEALLGEAYSITAEVIEGDRRGRRLGFPTVNQLYPEDKAPIRFGVYETRVMLDGEEYKGVTNVGHRPTFRTEGVFAETYIIDYDGDCYGKELKLSFKRYIREEKKFESVEELTSAIEADVLYVKENE